MHWIHLHFMTFTSWIVASHSFENWPWSRGRESHIERVMEGQDALLRCAGRLKNSTAFWEYKSCGSGSNVTSCTDALVENPYAWSPIADKGGTLHVLSAKPKDAGLYRCRQAATERIDIHSSVQLEVLPKDSDGDLPRFLDGLPKNITVYKYSQAVFQCKVLSRYPARILWVAQDARAEAGAIYYMEHWYVPLPPAGELGLPGGVHLSKMVLPRARPEDAGRYFCVAASNKGFTNSSAYLEVLGGDDDEWFKPSSEVWSLYLLFLLPVALALVPASLWFCYSLAKRYRSATSDEEQPEEDGFPLK